MIDSIYDKNRVLTYIHCCWRLHFRHTAGIIYIFVYQELGSLYFSFTVNGTYLCVTQLEVRIKKKLEFLKGVNLLFLFMEFFISQISVLGFVWCNLFVLWYAGSIPCAF